MPQQPAQQPGAADALRGRELMRLPQPRGVSRSRSRSPISQHPDNGMSDEEYHRRSRADEARVKVVLAKSSSPAAGHNYNWGLPAFDEKRDLLGYYQVNVRGTIAFEPTWATPNLLPADVALARYAYDQETKEGSDALHSLFQYDSVENLRRAAHRYYFSNNKPVLPWPKPSSQIPAHLIYLVPDADFSSLMMLLNNINDEYFQLDTPLQLGQLAVAAGPGTMDPSRLFELVDAGSASFEPRRTQEEGFDELLLDDGQHLPMRLLPAVALLRVHAMVFQDVTDSDEFFDLIQYTDNRPLLASDELVFEVKTEAGPSRRVRVMTRLSHLHQMMILIKEAVFSGYSFSRYLYHCGPEFINFLHVFILVVEQVAIHGPRNLEREDGHDGGFSFQIRHDSAPYSSDPVECNEHEAGRYYIVDRKHVVALGKLLEDVWLLHRSKFYMGGLLPDTSITCMSLPPCRLFNAYRPADITTPVTVPAIAPHATATAPDADS
jgi:hypothetical protein